MKNKFFTLLGAFCLLCSSRVWGYNASNANIYYDNTKSQWSSKNISIMIGRDHDWGGGKGVYSQYITMTAIANTNLYVKTSFSWSNYDSFLFFTHGDWGTSGESSNPDERVKYGDNYSGDYNVDMNECHLFTSTGSNKGDYINYAHNSSYTDLLNKNVKVQIRLSEDGGTTYKDTSTYFGTIKANRYTFTKDHKTSVEASEKTPNASSSNVTSAITATISFAESATADGYVFKGWGTTATKVDATEASWNYLCQGKDDETVYVFFMKNTKNLVVTSIDDNRGTVTGSVSDIATFNNPYTITATPKEGYEFDKWVVTNGEVEYAEGTSETDATAKINISDNVGIQATFKTTMTVYFVPSEADVNAGYNFVANIQYTSDEEHWTYGAMTLVDGVKYHCRPVYQYSATFASKDYAIGKRQFQTKDGETWKSQVELSTATTVGELNGKMIVATPAGGDEIAYTEEEPELLELPVYLKGTFNSWDESDPFVRDSCNTTVATVIKHLSADTYEFKIMNNHTMNNVWLGNNGEIKTNVKDWTFATSEDNCTIVASEEGDYQFTFDYATSKLSVTYPAYYLKYPWGTGLDEDWTWKMLDVVNEDGTYSIYDLYGGEKGIDYNTKASDAGKTHISYQDLTIIGDPQQGKPACFTYNPQTNAVSIENMYFPITMNKFGYATLYHKENLQIPEDVTAKYVTGTEGVLLTYQEVQGGVIPKETGVMLFAPANMEMVFVGVATATDEVPENIMAGSHEAKEINNSNIHYILSTTSAGQVGMLWPFGTTEGVGKFTNAANKAYMEIPGDTEQSAPVRARGGYLLNNDVDTPTELIDVNINANVNANCKVMINNQLIIIRDGIQYNAQGNRL